MSPNKWLTTVTTCTLVPYGLLYRAASVHVYAFSIQACGPVRYRSIDNNNKTTHGLINNICNHTDRTALIHMDIVSL